MPLDSRKVNLFIVGAAKCGTTSLHYYLSQHLDIFMCPVKEPNFFADVKSPFPSNYVRPKKGISYNSKIITDFSIYRSLFHDVENEKYIGESSTSYLWYEKSAERIFEYNPDAKIIILLGDPIERAYSHYLMYYYGGTESMTFTRKDLEPYTENTTKLGYLNPPYIEAGFYYKQIIRYTRLFKSEQIKIIQKNKLLSDTKSVLQELSEFLQISTQAFNNVKIEKLNVRMIPKNKMVPSLARFYNNFFLSKYLSNILSSDTKALIKNYLFSKNRLTEQPDKDTLEWLKKIYAPDLLLLSEYFNVVFEEK